jgi:DNA-binding transcriptional MerR regulator
MQTQPTSPYRTKHEAAQHLRVSINTIDNLTNRGILHPKRIIGARRVLFHIDDLENALFAVKRSNSRGGQR